MEAEFVSVVESLWHDIHQVRHVADALPGEDDWEAYVACHAVDCSVDSPGSVFVFEDSTAVVVVVVVVVVAAAAAAAAVAAYEAVVVG